MRTFIMLVLLVGGFHASGQTYDSLSLEQALDSAVLDTANVADDDSIPEVQYTQAPGDLSVTRQESEKTYRKESFDKEKWREIVGNTSYSEEAEQEKAKQNPTLPNIAVDPRIIQVIGYTIIGGLLAYLIYLFIKQAMKNPARNIQRGSALFTDSTNPEHVADLDLENLLQEALAQNNLRLAVRLYYIKLLKHLNRQGFIRWEKNKTDRDYANELVSNAFSGQFRKIMIAYEYVWYGERTPSAEEFKILESNFKTLYQTQRS